MSFRSLPSELVKCATAGVVAGFLIAGVGGCAGLSRDAPAAAVGDGEQLWALHRVRAAAVSSWRLEGKVGIRRDDRLWQAGLDWLHDGRADNMRLLGPGGRVLVRLKGTPDGADAVDSRGRVYRAATFEELAAEVLNVEVPISGLRHWVAGVPDPDARVQSMRVSRDGRMEELSQHGWRVRYLDYRPADSLSLQSLDLPSRLVLTRDDLKITVAVNRWRLLKFRGEVERMI